MYRKGKFIFSVVSLVFLYSISLRAQLMYVKGDVNGDAIVSMADAVYLESFLFNGDAAPACLAAADANNDNNVDIADAVMILSTLFVGGEIDPVPSDSLGCDGPLSTAAELDSGIAVSLDDVVRDGVEIHVPLRVWGKTGDLVAWSFVVSYPDETLQFEDVVVLTADGGKPDFQHDDEIEPGKTKIGVFYNLMVYNSYPIENGTIIADLVFTIKEQNSDVANVELSSVYGESELVFSERATFPFVSSGTISFGENVPEGTSDLVASSGNGQVDLSWINGQNYDEIQVERNGVAIATLPGNATSYVDSPPSGEFGYRVRGTESGVSSPAAFIFVSNFTIPPPRNISNNFKGDSSRELTWINDAEYDTLLLYRNGELLEILDGTQNAYTDGDMESILSIYYICGTIGEGRSNLVPFSSDLPSDVSYNGVENLSCIFQESGEIVLTWDPQEGAESYRIERGNEELALLPAEETGYTDIPSLDSPFTKYKVSTISNDNVVGWNSCRIENNNYISQLRARALVEESSVEFTWINEASFLTILIYCDGEQIAVLPGDTESFEYQFTANDTSTKTFNVCGIGEDFYSQSNDFPISDPSNQTEFLRGDANSDGTVSISDMILIRRYLFIGEEAPGCMDAADANDDGNINIADCVLILSSLYVEPTIFPEPYPIPGFDLTGDALLCENAEIIPGEKTEDLLTIGDVDAGVGQEVLIPVYLTHNEPVEGFQLVISYNPEQFTPYTSGAGPTMSGGLVYTNSIMTELHGDQIDFSAFYINKDDGYMVIGAFQSFINDHPIPAGENHLLLEIKGRISETVDVGDTIAINPINGLNGSEDGVGIHHLKNEITLTGAAKYVSFYPRTKGGNLRIKDNPISMDFLRGDVNSDGRLDLGDAISALNYLYVDGKKPLCTDAVDANDDGSIDLADPIYILDYLFKPKTKADAQLGECQPDMTNDNLRGCLYEYCR